MRLKFKPGDVHTLTQVSDRIIGMESKDGEATHRQSARYRIEVQDVDAAGHATLHVTIEDMATTIDVPSSWGSSEQPEETIAVLAKGLSFDVRLTAEGKVQQVDGADGVVNAIAESLQRPGLDRDKSRRVVEQQFSAESIQEMFENLFAYVPSAPVAVGGEWEDTQYHATGMPFRSDFRYALISVEGGVARIDYEATIRPHNTKATVALGMPFNFSGEEHGSLRVTEATGWIESAQGAYSIISETDGTASTVEGTETVTSSP